MNVSLSRAFYIVATFLFVLAGVGSALGLTVASRELVTVWGLAFFAAGHWVS